MTHQMKDSLVDLRGVSYHAPRDGSVVLSDITLSIAHGDISVFIGPNGAGKTTLVKIILGLLPASKGEVFVRPGLKIGYAPQHFHAGKYLPLTVRDFLRLTLRTSDKLDDIVSMLRIGHLMQRSIHNLSGGEAKLMLLARALATNSELIVLDEVAGYFDLQGKDFFYSMLKTIRDSFRCAIVLVSHDLVTVMRHADSVFCINKCMHCHGVPDVVMAHPSFKHLFAEELVNSAIYTHHV